MLEAVGLGVRGVLVPQLTFWMAGIQAASSVLESHGIQAEQFELAAGRRVRRDGPRGLISRCLRDLKAAPPTWAQRQAVLAARGAVPAVGDLGWLRTLLAAVATDHQLGFVDNGVPEVMDAVLDRLGLGALPARRVWTRSLGLDVALPRPFAFRWLAERWGLRPQACLYVAGTRAGWEAARQARWRVEPSRSLDPPDACGWEAADLEALLERLAASALVEGTDD